RSTAFRRLFRSAPASPSGRRGRRGVAVLDIRAPTRERRRSNSSRAQSGRKPKSGSSSGLLKREDALPVVPHADDDPALLLGYVIHLLAEGSDRGVGQALRGPIGIF